MDNHYLAGVNGFYGFIRLMDDPLPFLKETGYDGHHIGPSQVHYIKSERHCVLQKPFVFQGMNNQKRVPFLLCSSPSAITMLSLLQSLEGQLEL